MKTAVLLVTFNRPELTKAVLDLLRQVRPQRLYFASDGPRQSHPEDVAKVTETRALVEQIDWPCIVKVNLQNTNLGCRWAVTTALDWFFENEPEGIVLEDDVIPDPSFFPYCEQLIERYRDEPRIMAITACNFQPPDRTYDASYYFSCFNHVWGWASWRRAWELNDPELSSFPSNDLKIRIEALSQVNTFHSYWIRAFQDVKLGKIDTWDYVWTMSCWAKGGLTCTPSTNLVQNIGFGADATHTTSTSSEHATLKRNALIFPLVHPKKIERGACCDEYVVKHHYGLANVSPTRLWLKHVARVFVRWRAEIRFW